MWKAAFSVCLLLLALSGYSVAQAQNAAQVVIDAYHNTAMVEQGTTLILVCRVVGVPSTAMLSYQWTCPGGYCDAGAVDPEWAARIQQGNILVVNVRRTNNDNGGYTCTVMANAQRVGAATYTLSVANGLSLVNEDGGLRVFFPRTSFVTNTTLTHTNTPRFESPEAARGNDHIVCYGGNLQSSQAPWYNSNSGVRLAACGQPCRDCGDLCVGNGGVGVDPPLNGQTHIHMYTDLPAYVNQDLECRAPNGRSAFIGVYLESGENADLQPPSSITQGATTTTSVSVSWSQVLNATGYYVSYQRQDLGAPPVVTPQYERIVEGATSVTLSGLEPGTTYRIRVWSTDGASVSSGTTIKGVTTEKSAPSPPRMLTTTGAPTGSTVELNWLPPLHPNGAIHYEIEYEPAMTPGDPINAGNSSSPYFTLTLPNEFLTYNVRVAAVNSNGSAQSSPLPVCPGESREEVPQPPMGISVVASGCNSANMSWNASVSRMCDAVIENYSVRYRLTSGEGGYVTVSTSSTSAALGDLMPNAEYNVEVASVNSNGVMSAYSAVTQLRVQDPDPPPNVAAGAIGCNSAMVSWDPSQSMFDDMIMNYSVRYQLTTGTGGSATVYSSSTSVTLQGLVPNAEYTVEVAGINSCGGTSTFAMTTFDLQDLGPPTGVSVVAGTECGTAAVSWSPSQVNYNATIGNYSVRYRLRSSTGGYTTVYSSSTSVTLRGLDSSMEYTVEVAAIDSCGRLSEFSMVAQLNLQAPEPPTGVSVVDGTECYTSVVSWTPQLVCGVVIGNYSVRYQLRNGTGSYTTVYSSSTSVTLQDLAPNAKYNVSVAAISSGQPAELSTFTETTDFELKEPKPPAGVTFTVTGSDFAMVSWTASQSVCDDVVGNYSVRYRLRSGTGAYTTVYTDRPSVTLRDLIPNAEYVVSVAAINSMGDMSALSVEMSFTVSTPATPMSTPTTAPPTSSPGPQTGGDSTIITIAAVIVVVLVVVAVVIVVVVILGVCCWRRKKKGKLYEPSIRASKPTFQPNSSAVQFDNMYAEVRETNGQPEKPPIDFDNTDPSSPDYDYARVPKKDMFKAATEEAVDQPQSTPIVEHQYAAVTKTDKNMPTAMAATEDTAPNPGDGSPHPQPKAHRKPPPPKPSPFSGRAGKGDQSVMNDGAFDGYLKRVEGMHAQGKSSFETEFNSVDKKTASSTAIAVNEFNNAKNRYKNIFPYDSSRVLLLVPNTSGTDYINASFVDGYKKKDRYIASQAPVPGTVDDFWQMMWDQKINMVVMLTKTVEGTKRKSEDYYAESPGDTFSSRRFQIRTISLKYHVEYEVRVFEVAQASDPSQTRTLDHYLFTGWPDYGVPKYPTSLIRMLYHVRDARVSDMPILVHCSAGVGRSGTFIALDITLDQMDAEKTVDVKGTMQRMREKRMYMIQTVDQYMFVYDAVRELLLLGDTTIKASELRKAIAELKEGGGTGYQKQFASLNTLTQESADDEKVEGDPEIIRYLDRSPIKGKHLFVSRPMSGGPVVMNASFVDGYHAPRAFIAAQSPMQSTVHDFWTLIAEKKVQTVLLLCQLVEDSQETCHMFWPPVEGGTLEVGNMKITMVKSTATNDIDTYQFTIEKPRSTQDVTLLHYKQWPEKKRPKSTSFLKLFTSAQKMQQPHSNKPIVVACNDGLGRTGTFIAIWSLIEQMKAEGQIDVVGTIKSIRTQRPGAMPHMDQYVYCHDLLLEYVDSFEGYSNFNI